MILPLVAPFFDKNVSSSEFASRITSLTANLSDSVVLGLAELPGSPEIPPATLAEAFAAAPGHLGIFIDCSSGMGALKTKKDVTPPHAKIFISTLTNLIEAWALGTNGCMLSSLILPLRCSNVDLPADMGIAGAFFPHIVQWVFSHRSDKVELNQQRSAMIQRFLSVADLTVKRFFPTNAKMFLRLTNDPAFQNLEIVTRQQHNADSAPGEEDIVRLTHLQELVHYVMDGLKEEDKGQGPRKDGSMLL